MERRHGFSFFLLAILLASVAPSFALDPRKSITQYPSEVWRTRDGLPHNSVTAILQTRNGYLWLGTVAGLVRFDGVRFTVFDSTNTPALPNAYVTSLVEDRTGRLWIGTISGGITRLTGDRFDHFGQDQGLPSAVIYSLIERRDGTIVVGTDNGAVQIADGAVRRLPGLDLAGETISALFEDRKGALWIGADGLYRFRGGHHDRFGIAHGLPSEIISSVIQDADARIWVATAEGLAVSEGDRFVRVETGLADPFVRTVYVDRDQNLWIGTRAGGIARISDDGRTERFSTREGLPSDLVRAFAEDREGNLWLATGGGLSRLKDGLFTPLTRSEGLSDDFIWTIHADETGRIWIGTNGQGVDWWDNGVVGHLSATLSSNSVRTIASAGETLWLGTVGRGITAVSPSETRYFTTADGLPSDFILALYRDGARIWVGTDRGVDAIENGVVVEDPAVRPIGTAVVRAFHRDRRGNLWIGTLDGLFRLTADKRMRRFGRDSGLPSDRILALHEDNDALWIGTQDAGLVRFEGGAFTRWTASDGLCDDLIHAIAEDASGFLWLSSNRGICRIGKNALLRKIASPVPYGESDGMRSSECNGGFPAVTRGENGTLWFPTIRGAVTVDPATIAARRTPPPVLVEEVLIAGKRHPVGKEFTLPLGVRNVEIRYTALSFLAPEKTRFVYMLEGFDPEWIDAGRRRVAFYTQLPPGRFVFRVTASSGDGAWTAEDAMLIVIVPPHFYETPWFIALVVLAALVLVVIGYRLRMRQLSHRERSLKQMVDDRTRQLKKANDTLVHLSLLDPLTEVPNRRQFATVLDIEWRRARRAHTPMSLIMIDIDYFKDFNDTYGHQQGDECLKKVAETLTSATGRVGDLVARYGGEEFAMILATTDALGASMVADLVRAKVEALNIPHQKSPISPFVTISLGIAAVVPSDNHAAEDLVAAADAALYQAKEQGRNRSVTAEKVEGRRAAP